MLLARLTPMVIAIAVGAIAIAGAGQVDARLTERDVARSAFGPDGYMLVLGLALVAAGIGAALPALRSRAEPQVAEPAEPAEPDPGDPERIAGPAPVPISRVAIVGLVACFAVYGLMVQYVGYVSGSLVFFLCGGRLMGVSWRGAAALAVLGTLGLHLLFAESLNVPFPRTPFI